LCSSHDGFEAYLKRWRVIMRSFQTWSVLTFLFVWSLAVTPAAQAAFITEGDSQFVVAPHHDTHPVPTHFFATTGDNHHFSWAGGLGTPTPVTIKYDFRPRGGFPNLITAAQTARATDALNAWTAASNGAIMFVQDTLGPESGIINIGTGDLAALGFVSGPGGTLGLGGGIFSHGVVNHTIGSGVAWQDFAENWDTVIGNGNPVGTFDYFTVVAQEIGHAMGLGHTDDLVGADIMDGGYIGEFGSTTFSANDNAHIQTIHGVIPEPSSLVLLGIGAIGLLGYGWRRKRKQAA
jgi:hypothetical protein